MSGKPHSVDRPARPARGLRLRVPVVGHSADEHPSFDLAVGPEAARRRAARRAMRAPVLAGAAVVAALASGQITIPALQGPSASGTHAGLSALDIRARLADFIRPAGDVPASGSASGTTAVTSEPSAAAATTPTGNAVLLDTGAVPVEGSSDGPVPVRLLPPSHTRAFAAEELHDDAFLVGDDSGDQSMAPRLPEPTLSEPARRRAVEAPPAVAPATGAADVPVRPARAANAAARSDTAGRAIPTAPTDGTDRVTATVGASVSLDWPETLDRVAVADDAYARVQVVSRKELMVTGLEPGRTSLAVWLASGRRVLRTLVVEPNLDQLRAALEDLDPALMVEAGPDASSIVVRGQVGDEAVARQARSLVDQLVPRSGKEPLRVVNLIRYAGGMGTSEDRLAAAMAAIDPRIRVRRVQTGAEADAAKDSYVLEGQVADVNALVRAVVLAERQLGGTGTRVKAADTDRVTFTRNQGGAAMGGGGGGGGGGMQGLQGGAPPQSGLSAQLARGLLLTSESGRVVSFLKVDSIPQVMVSIRVLQIDRAKARRMGMNLRFDSERLAIGNTVIPGTGVLPPASQNAAAAAGNVIASYVGSTRALLAAVDLLSQKQVARSVAEPNVLTLSGESASVLVGGEVPVPDAVSNQVAVQSSFSFRQYGVRMDIRPTVDEQGSVALEVAPGIVTPSQLLGNTSVPGFTIQRVETTARVAAGESLVLGGLLSSSESSQERGIPGLERIPLFRWQRKVTENTELLFVITPRIVDGANGNDVRLPSLTYQDSPNRLGVSGLDSTGVPVSFKGQTVQVIGRDGLCAEMRSAPAGTGVVSDCLLPGSAVVVLESSPEWQRVRTEAGGQGWVPSARLRATPELR